LQRLWLQRKGAKKMLRLPMNNPGGRKFSEAIAAAIENAVETVFGPNPGEEFGRYIDVVNGRVNQKLKDIIDMERVHNFMKMSGIEDKPITIHTKDGKSVDIDPAYLLWALAGETISTANNWTEEVTDLQASFVAFLFGFLSSQDSLYLLGYADNLYKRSDIDFEFVYDEKHECHALLMEKDPVFYDLLLNAKFAVLDTVEHGNSPDHVVMDKDFIELAMDWCKKNRETQYFTMHWPAMCKETSDEPKDDRILTYKAAVTANQHINSMGIKFSPSVRDDLLTVYADAIIDYYKWLLNYLYSIDSKNGLYFSLDDNVEGTHIDEWTFEDENYNASDYLNYLDDSYPIRNLLLDKKSVLFGKKRVAPFTTRFRKFGQTKEDLWHISCVCELEGFINAAN